jgi:hypothetical protein
VNDSLAGCSPDVVGRDAECARVDSFVEALPWGARALLIRGEPGIGKTTLWRHAIGRCRTAGHRVLVTRTAEEEMSLAHVGLADLFEEIDTDPALLRDDDAMARGRAVLTALRGLADTGPVVLAIDDAQWLDSASARAVRYALRRFETEPVGVLATTRVGADAGDPLAASTAFAPTGYELLELGPLTLGALRRARRDGSEHLTAVAPPDLRRVGRQSALRDRAGPRPRNGRPGLGSDRRSPASRLRPGCHCPQARDRAARAPGRSRGRIGSRPDVGGRAGQHRGGGAARGAAAGRRAAPVARRRRVRLPASVCTRAWPSSPATPTPGPVISRSRRPSRTPALPHSSKPPASVPVCGARPMSPPTSPGMLSG